MASKRIKGIIVEIGGDTSPLGKALKEVDEQSKKTQSELKEINRGLKEAPESTVLWKQKQELLTKAIEESKDKLKILQSAQEEMNRKYEAGEIGEETYRNFQREVEKAKSETKKLSGELSDTNNKLGELSSKSEDAGKKLDDMGDDAKEAGKEVDDAGDKTEDFGDKLDKTAAVAVAAGAAIVGALAGCVETSRDYRTEIGKLETAFSNENHSAETAKRTYEELQGILGETDQAVEASAFIAKLADNEKELATWIDIATGAYATFGNSLPIESLTEAANETSKTGALTGGLADALNWAGVNEEEFQAKLDKCNTEQERQALITETLIGLYGETADVYRKNNEEIIEANKASETWNSTLAEVGEAVEPIMTKFKEEGADIVKEILPKALDYAEKFNYNLPEMLDTVEDMLPLIQGIGTGFISWKALSGIGAGISKAKELTDILKNTSNFAGLASSGILGIAGALAIGVGSYVYSANKAKEEKLDKIFEEVTEASDLCAESIKENSDKMSELKESAREAADSELALTDNTENLWKELQLLVDENGKVKEGYEDRVAFISNELTEATGEEIALIDGQIQKYDDLKAKIGEVIERQRAEILQRSYSSAYEEAISQNSSTAKDIVAARSRIDEQSAFISQMYGNARKDFESAGMLYDFTKLGNLSLSNLDSWKDVFSDEELSQLRGAFTAIEQERANISGYQQQYSDNAYIISQYEKAQEAMLAGNYNNAQIAFSAIDDLEYASLQDSKKNLDEKLDAIEDMVDGAVKEYKEGINLGDKYAKETFSGTIATIIQQATEGGISAGELLESGIVTELSKIDGFDATMLLEFANALGVDFGTVFGYVSAEKAGAIMNSTFAAYEVKTNISEAGNNVVSKVKEFLNLPMMADGGFLHNGAAVISEAGPELLEIMNGGAKVTPLTGTAKNTAVNGTGPRNVTVNQYIHVNELKNSYDTRRMAQDLSAETRRVEAGKGKNK